MAPNIVDKDTFERPAELERDNKQRQEIFYDGYFYDVTDFVSRHPGGGIIKFYTEKGEDATQAIQQFHYRSRDRVNAILKTFKRRRAEPHERGLDRNALTRHEALDADYKKLFKELEEEGYFEPSVRHTIIRLTENISLAVLTFGLYNYAREYQLTFLKHFCATLMGYMMSRFAELVHDGGHNALTGSPKVDKLIGVLCASLACSGSNVWWNSQHNRHHAMPQRLTRDVDLSTLPYVAFHKRTVNDRKEINSFFIKYQAILYWTLDLMVIVVAWKFVIHPRYQLKKKAYFEMFLNLPSYWLMYHYGVIWYFYAAYWFAFFLAVNFSLSHSHLGVADKPTHWIEYSLTHSANITSSIYVDYWMAYLNYQIEHHLFPTIPQFRLREITHRVKALADKHGLPYKMYSYPEACYLMMKNLNKVGHELTSKDHFDKSTTLEI